MADKFPSTVYTDEHKKAGITEEELARLPLEAREAVRSRFAKESRKPCKTLGDEFYACAKEHPFLTWKCTEQLARYNECISEHSTQETFIRAQIQFMLERKEKLKRMEAEKSKN